MALWATKRRIEYGGVFILALALIFTGVFFAVFHRTPTCSDGKQNGDEAGIDCGGSCKLICTSDALTPVVLWSKIFNVSGDVYSAVAYVENPNINSKNAKAGYKFKILDANNKLIATKTGETSIPKNKKFAVFEVGIVLKDVKPKLAQFEFTSFGPWEKDTQKEPEITIRHSALLSTTTAPRIDGTIQNDSLTQSVHSLELDVFITDSKGNAVAASRTFVDSLGVHTSQDFVFTWPKPFDLGVEECATSQSIATTTDSALCDKKPNAIDIIYRPL